MPTPEKIEEVALLTKKFQDSEGFVVADFTGLSVAQSNELRAKCREAGVEFRVVKNRLARRAVADAEFDGVFDMLKGPSGIAFGMEGPVAPAKVLVDYASDNEKLLIRGGFLDGQLLDVSGVVAMSKVPSRDELLAMIARGFQAPTQNFVTVLSGTLSQFVRALNAVAEQKADAA
jgi:large subunit ribosomal protein L10